VLNEQFKYSELTGKIIGCAMAVHRGLGNGFPEVFYQRALAMELNAADIPFEREFEMSVYYKDEHIGKRRVDFLVQNIISVELKAVSEIEGIHIAQAINYLEIYNLEVGLLINFGQRSLQFKRFNNKKYRGPQSQ
jgi:GxxExxY protein